MHERKIILRGVRVHNLKGVDLDLPHRRLIVFCGVSGSGKTSLALDTLYAEGQRRYIESFSAYTRQFLEQLEKPEADRIDGIPPAVAVTHRTTSRSSRSTVGTATEIVDYLRLLYSRIGEAHCPQCGAAVRRDAPEEVAEELMRFPAGARYLVAFPWQSDSPEREVPPPAALMEDGFRRAILGGRIVELDALPPADGPEVRRGAGAAVVVDRLSAGAAAERIRDSLEIAFEKGGGRCSVYVQGGAKENGSSSANAAVSGTAEVAIDGTLWRVRNYSRRLGCADCGINLPEPQPRLFSFNSPLGACATCEGFGNIIDNDPELIIPDPSKTIREGAIAPWTSPAYQTHLEELLARADELGVPVDVPFRELAPAQAAVVFEGLPEKGYGGLRGFFEWLERRKYKMHLRVFLSRWRSYRTCPACGGGRLRPEARAWRIGGKSLDEVCRMQIGAAAAFFAALPLSDHQARVARTILEQVCGRLGFLEAVGVGYLSLDRTLRTLSGGEAQRVMLTSALGSSLVNMLYVLDEPSVGLHPCDVDRLTAAIERLRDRGNTVVVVEHEEALLRRADHLVEIGPGAGERGGTVVFQGTTAEMLASEVSLTGDYLAGRRGVSTPERRRPPNHGWIRLSGARGNNLKELTVEFPLGVLCVVTGVSGAGKSTLVEDTLYPALCRRKRKDAPKPMPFGDVVGDGQIDDVILVDQSPIGRSPRSNPVTYIKAFDAIRQVFAETVAARTRNYSASLFSFNVEGGRCPACQGDGYIQIDMQFLADVFMRCPTCQGRRYRDDILQITHRNRSIADVLEMTVREAFHFFRGHAKVQAKLKRLIDVGLDYLRLGQPANTLSAGEAQRLKLAGHLASGRRGRTLFILDEPTTGLHFSDIVQLIDCFEALLAVGHSLIVVEHNLQLMKAADYLIDLGPGAAEEGGRVVVQGTPEKVAQCPVSRTGKFLAAALRARN